MHWFAFVFSATAAFAATAPAAWAQTAWMPPGETACAIGAWVTDKDPNGLNVRAAPSGHAAIIGTIPPATGKYELSADLKIIGSRNGWLRIVNARDYAADFFSLPPRKAYSGEGWVHGSRVGFDVRSGIGFERPDPASRRLFSVYNDGLGDVGAVISVAACQGEWALLDYRLTQRRTKDGSYEQLSPGEQEKLQGRAWFRGICSIQETSCTAEHTDRESQQGGQ